MEWTQAELEEVVSFTQELVRCPGISGQEKETASAIKRKMKALGYDKVEQDQWGNVIGTIHGAKPGGTIVFDGHMDVVPLLMPELWEHEPYGGEISEGKLWGIGASDMKGGLAAAVCAAGFIDRKAIAGTILVTGSVAEELLIGRGFGKVLENRQVDGVIECEPTHCKLGIGGVGRTTVEMTNHGLAAHSQVPHLGDNAVYRAMDASGRIRDMPRRIDPLFGTEVIELVEVRSKPSPGNGCVPNNCWVLWECRLLPGETRASFMGRFQDALKDFDGVEKIDLKYGNIAVDCYTGERLEYEDFLSAWETPPESSLRRIVENALVEIGIGIDPIIKRGCTNCNVSAGILGIPSLVFGPGMVEVIHKPNEHVEIDALLNCAKVYAKIIELTGQNGR